jgi:8-oxo-dGTP diphosphatase
VDPTLKNIPTWLPVVAAALVDQTGRLLMHRRPAGKPHAGLWEFPGGKVEAFETPQEALERELLEELGVNVCVGFSHPAAFAQSLPGEDALRIVILLYKVTQWEGEPRALEGGECDWFTLDEARMLEKPPLDRRLFEQISTHWTF